MTIIDAHMHYGTDPAIAEHLIVPYVQYDQPASIIRMLDDYGLDRGVLLPPDRILNPPYDTDYREANEAVSRAVATYADRFVGAIRLNPLFGVGAGGWCPRDTERRPGDGAGAGRCLHCHIRYPGLHPT